jgi:hypothetical protein
MPWQAFAAVVLTLPALAVVITRVSQGSVEPSSAVAASSDSKATSLAGTGGKKGVFPLPTQSPEDSVLIEKYASIMKLEFGEKNPLKIAANLRRPTGVESTNPGRGGDVLSSITFPEDVHLTTIFVTKEMTTAVVDDSTVRIGDVIAEVWQVAEIDPVQQFVILRHPTGAEHRLTLREEKAKEPEPKRGRTKPGRKR